MDRLARSRGLTPPHCELGLFAHLLTYLMNLALPSYLISPKPFPQSSSTSMHNSTLARADLCKQPTTQWDLLPPSRRLLLPCRSRAFHYTYITSPRYCEPTMRCLPVLVISHLSRWLTQAGCFLELDVFGVPLWIRRHAPVAFYRVSAGNGTPPTRSSCQDDNQSVRQSSLAGRFSQPYSFRLGWQAPVARSNDMSTTDSSEKYDGRSGEEGPLCSNPYMPTFVLGVS